MDACRTTVEAVAFGLGHRFKKFGSSSLWLNICVWGFCCSAENMSFAEELPRVAVAANKGIAAPNDPVLSYQNVGQFQGNVYVTKNFRVQAASPQLAQAVGDRAEGYRELLATQWLGYTLPDWQQSCPIEVNISHQAHGETSFLVSENGVDLPSDWEMKVFGPTDRLLDSVLPHEITHTIFASHFKQRLPRWADEGACTTIEHLSEREKIHALLLRYLSPEQRQGIPFNRMFPMRDYPSDMLPLYAQGYSVSKFLIAQGGHRQFVQLLERGLQHERRLPVTVAWDQAMREIYGYQDLSDLQLDWLSWVGEGSLEASAVARLEQRTGTRVASLITPETDIDPAVLADLTTVNSTTATDENFYVRQMRTSSNSSGGSPITPNATTPLPTAPLPTTPTLDAPPVGQAAYRSDSTILLPQRLR